MKELTLHLVLRRIFTWKFVIADVYIPILGADVLSHYNLSVNMHNQILSNNLTDVKVKEK